jgi:hypothetical protein
MRVQAQRLIQARERLLIPVRGFCGSIAPAREAFGLGCTCPLQHARGSAGKLARALFLSQPIEEHGAKDA